MVLVALNLQFGPICWSSCCSLFELPCIGSPLGSRLVSAVESVGGSLRIISALLFRSSMPLLNVTRKLCSAALRTTNRSKTTAKTGPRFFPKLIKCSVTVFQSISLTVCVTTGPTPFWVIRLIYNNNDIWSTRAQEIRQTPIVLTIDCDTLFAPISRPVAMATSGNVANTSTSSLKKTTHVLMISWQSWMRRTNVRDIMPATTTNITPQVIVKMVQATRTSVEMVLA